ncbi:hypothetical protein BGZ65_009206, partial [Modicella reniformis]
AISKRFSTSHCPENVYITKWTSKLPALPDATLDASQQVVINVSDNNFSEIFPKDHVEFIDRLKNCSVEDDDGQPSLRQREYQQQSMVTPLRFYSAPPA